MVTIGLDAAVMNCQLLLSVPETNEYKNLRPENTKYNVFDSPDSVDGIIDTLVFIGPSI